MLYYHGSTWRNNYGHVRQELDRGDAAAASMRPFRGSLFRFLVVYPTSKNPANQWNPPPFKNAQHVLLVAGYAFLLGLHVAPFVTPRECLAPAADGADREPSFLARLAALVPTGGRTNALCCRYNYAMSGFEAHQMNQNYCSGRVRVVRHFRW